jgi:hypothetical protein
MQINRLLKICFVYLIIATPHKACAGVLKSKFTDFMVTNAPFVSYYLGLMDDTQQKVYRYTQYQKKRKANVDQGTFSAFLLDFDPTGLKDSALYKKIPNKRRFEEQKKEVEKEIAIRKAALKDLENPPRDWEELFKDKDTLEKLGATHDDVARYIATLNKAFESPYYKKKQLSKPDVITHIKRNIEQLETQLKAVRADKEFEKELEKKLRTYRAIEH